jgi:hypothetical protein
MIPEVTTTLKTIWDQESKVMENLQQLPTDEPTNVNNSHTKFVESLKKCIEHFRRQASVILFLCSVCFIFVLFYLCLFYVL